MPISRDSRRRFRPRTMRRISGGTRTVLREPKPFGDDVSISSSSFAIALSTVLSRPLLLPPAAQFAESAALRSELLERSQRRIDSNGDRRDRYRWNKGRATLTCVFCLRCIFPSRCIIASRRQHGIQYERVTLPRPPPLPSLLLALRRGITTKWRSRCEIRSLIACVK